MNPIIRHNNKNPVSVRENLTGKKVKKIMLLCQNTKVKGGGIYDY